MSAPRCGCDRISSQSSSVRRVPVSVWSGKVNLPTSWSRPGGVDQLLLADGHARGGGGRLGEPGDGGRVARGHPVAHPERLDHHADHALVQRLELGDLDAQLVALALVCATNSEQHPQRDQHDGEHRDRDQPDLLVGRDRARGDQPARRFPREHRQVEPPRRGGEARAVAQAEHADDEQEVQRARGEVDGEDDRRAAEARRTVRAGIAERLQQRVRRRRGRRSARRHCRRRAGTACGSRSRGGERREGDDRRRRRPEQGHRDRGGDQRRADVAAAGPECDELARQRQPQQGGEQAERLPVLRVGAEHGGADRCCQEHGLTGGDNAVPPANPRSRRGPLQLAATATPLSLVGTSRSLNALLDGWLGA